MEIKMARNLSISLVFAASKELSLLPCVLFDIEKTLTINSQFSSHSKLETFNLNLETVHLLELCLIY